MTPHYKTALSGPLIQYLHLKQVYILIKSVKRLYMCKLKWENIMTALKKCKADHETNLHHGLWGGLCYHGRRLGHLCGPSCHGVHHGQNLHDESHANCSAPQHHLFSSHPLLPCTCTHIHIKLTANWMSLDFQQIVNGWIFCDLKMQVMESVL